MISTGNHVSVIVKIISCIVTFFHKTGCFFLKLESQTHLIKYINLSVNINKDVEVEEDADDIQEDVESSETDKTLYSDIIKKGGYRNYSNRTPAKQVVPEEEKEEIEDMGGPYVISPDEFDDNDDYEVVSLVYYSDGVLADEYDNVIEDVEGMVGEDSLNHFGEYGDDSVFVRNDERKTDYEILLDSRNFADI